VLHWTVMDRHTQADVKIMWPYSWCSQYFLISVSGPIWADDEWAKMETGESCCWKWNHWM